MHERKVSLDEAKKKSYSVLPTVPAPHTGAALSIPHAFIEGASKSYNYIAMQDYMVYVYSVDHTFSI